jgi:hypothetical protein
MSSHSVPTHTACKAAITQILTQMFAKLEQVGGGDGAGLEREGEREGEEEDEQEEDEDEEMSAMLLAKSLVGSVFQSLGLHVNARRHREGEDTVDREEREERELREEMKERMKEKRVQEEKIEKEKKSEKKLEEDMASPFHTTPLPNGVEESEKKSERAPASEEEEERGSKEERPSTPELKGNHKSSPTPASSSGSTNSVAKKLPDISPELAVPPNPDAIPHDDPNVVFHDCFLVFRALCKLSIKDVRPVESYFTFSYFESLSNSACHSS